MAHKYKNNKGLTLVEILIATGVIVFTSVVLLQLYLSCLNLSEMNNNSSSATAHLTIMLEAIRCTPFSQILVDFPNGDVDGPAGNNYATLVGGYVLPQEQIVVTYVDTAADPLEIIVRISWQDKRGDTLEKYLITKRTR